MSAVDEREEHETMTAQEDAAPRSASAGGQAPPAQGRLVRAWDTLARAGSAAWARLPQGVARQRMWLALRIFVSFALIVLVLAKAHITQFVAVLTHINPLLWALGFAVGVVSNVISAFQWHLLLRSEGIAIRFRSSVALYMMGHTFSQLLPTSIGGDVGKAVYVAKLYGNGVGAASATLMARVIGVLGLLLTTVPVAVVASILVPGLGWSLALILVGVGIGYLVCLIVLLRSPDVLTRFVGERFAATSLFGKVMKLAHTISRYRGRPRTFWAATLVSVAFYAASNLNFYVYGAAVHLQTPFWFYWIAIPLSSLITLLPISINGYGVRGASFVALFALTGESAASALSLSLLAELQLFLLALVGVGILFHYNRVLARPTEAFDARVSATPAVAGAQTGATWRSTMAAYGTDAVTIVPVLTSMRVDDAREEHPDVKGARSATAEAPARKLRMPSLPPMPPFVRGMRTTTKAAILAALLLVVVVGIFGADKLLNGTPRVQVYTVSSQALTSYVAGGGLTYPIESLQMTYPVSAEVIKVNAQVGQPVQAGQPLLTLDGGSASTQLAQAYTEWQLAQSYVFQLEGVNASGTQLAAARQQAAIAKARYDALNAQLQSPTLNNGIVSAPFAGVVTDVRVTPGSQARAGQTLLTLQNLDSIIVRAQFPIDQVSQVQVGARVEVDPAAAGARAYVGAVTSINPALVNQGSATFEALITVPNPQHELFTGESVYTRVSATHIMLTVPEVAVINPQSDSIVFVYNHGVAHLRHVVVGPRDLDRFGIVSGLQAGDQVIVTGQDQLVDNEHVALQR